MLLEQCQNGASFATEYRLSGKTKQNHNRIICLTGWWFGTFSIFPYFGNVIIPTDELIFFRGVETTNQLMFSHILGPMEVITTPSATTFWANFSVGRQVPLVFVHGLGVGLVTWI